MQMTAACSLMQGRTKPELWRSFNADRQFIGLKKAIQSLYIVGLFLDTEGSLSATMVVLVLVGVVTRFR